MSTKFFPRGVVLLAQRDDSVSPAVPLAFKSFGCADVINLGMTVESFEHIEKCTGQDLVDFRGTKSKKAELQLTGSEWTLQNMLLGLNATRTAADSAPQTPVVGELSPDEMESGDFFLLGGATPHQNITALTIVDSTTGSPIALTVDVDYSFDAVFGWVKLLKDPVAEGWTLPLVCNYTYQDQESLAMLNAGTLERWMRFNVVDKANELRKSVVDLYRVQFDPTSALNLLPDELGQIDLRGNALYDDTRPSSDEFGSFGRMTRAADA
jgi:hypothetical protein